MIYHLPFNHIGAGLRLKRIQYDHTIARAASDMAAYQSERGKTLELVIGILPKPSRRAFAAIESGNSLPDEMKNASLMDIRILPTYTEENIRWILYTHLPMENLLNSWPDAMSLADIINEGYPLLPQHALALLRTLGKGCSGRTRSELADAIDRIHERFPDRPEFQAIGLYGDGDVVFPEHYDRRYLRKIILPR